MSSGSTGRCANREPDQALITASFAAQRAAKWRAAEELLSEASRRSPGVNVAENTVPGWSTCSAKSGMETRSIPTPTMPMGRQVNGWSSPATMRSAQWTEAGVPPAAQQRGGEPDKAMLSSGRGLVDSVDVAAAQPGGRVQQHRRLLTLLRSAVVEATVRWPLVHRLTAGN